MYTLKNEKNDSQVRLINKIINSNRGAFCLFLGAGCSVSSGIPLSSQVIEILRKLTFIEYQSTFNPPIREINEDFKKFLDRVDSHILKYQIEFNDFVESVESDFFNNLQKPVKLTTSGRFKLTS